MRDPTGDEFGLVGPVDPDVPARGPVGQRRGLRAGPEGDGSVDRAGVALEAVADVEVAGRGGGRGPADPDRGPEDGAPVAQQRQRQPRAIDDQPRVHLFVAAERRTRQPSRSDRARGQARADPQAAARIARASEDEHEVRGVLWGARRQPRHRSGARRRRGARDRRAPEGRPRHRVRVGAQRLRSADREAPARRRGNVVDVGARPARALRCAAAGQPRDDDRGADGCHQPVNFGPLRLVLRMTKCVSATIRVAAGRDSGSSNGPATGGLPARRRIHAA